MDSEKIRLQAKEIMDEFVRALSKVDVSEDYGLEREEQLRSPGDDVFPGFRDAAFRNAPRKNRDFFIADRKKW